MNPVYYWRCSGECIEVYRLGKGFDNILARVQDLSALQAVGRLLGAQKIYPGRDYAVLYGA